MSKVKLNPGLIGIVLLTSLFAGWETLLIVTALILIFCEVDDKIKSLIVKVVAFFAGLALVTMAWNLIVNGINVIFTGIDDFINIINSYLGYGNQVNVASFNSYLVNPIKYVLDIADKVMQFLFTFVKFAFIVAVLNNKPAKENFVMKKVNQFVDKAVSYVNSLG